MKAVISCGGVQHLVSKDDVLVVNSLGSEKEISLTPLMMVDGDKSIVDTAKLSKAKVVLEVKEQLKGDKVVALRYKAKKRVNTKRGHRQHQTKVLVKQISL